MAIKIKIAAWWMIVIGAMVILWTAIETAQLSHIPLAGRILIRGVIILPFLLSICGGIFLLQRKRWAWLPSVILTLIIIVFSFLWMEEHYLWVLIFVSNIFILALVLLDRKKFLQVSNK